MVKKENNGCVESSNLIKQKKNYFYCEECDKLVGKNWWKRHLKTSLHEFNLIVAIQNIINEQLLREFDYDEEASIGSVRERETWETYKQLRNTGYFDNMQTLEDFNLKDYNDRVDEILKGD